VVTTKRAEHLSLDRHADQRIEQGTTGNKSDARRPRQWELESKRSLNRLSASCVFIRLAVTAPKAVTEQCALRQAWAISHETPEPSVGDGRVQEIQKT